MGWSDRAASWWRAGAMPVVADDGASLRLHESRNHTVLMLASAVAMVPVVAASAALDLGALGFVAYWGIPLLVLEAIRSRLAVLRADALGVRVRRRRSSAWTAIAGVETVDPWTHHSVGDGFGLVLADGRRRRVRVQIGHGTHPERVAVLAELAASVASMPERFGHEPVALMDATWHRAHPARSAALLPTASRRGPARWAENRVREDGDTVVIGASPDMGLLAVAAGVLAAVLLAFIGPLALASVGAVVYVGLQARWSRITLDRAGVTLRGWGTTAIPWRDLVAVETVSSWSGRSLGTEVVLLDADGLRLRHPVMAARGRRGRRNAQVNAIAERIASYPERLGRPALALHDEAWAQASSGPPLSLLPPPPPAPGEAATG